MKGLRVLVDFETSKRAGNINPRKSAGLPSSPLWQNTDQGVEIRFVVNGQTQEFEGVEGITILDGEQAIDEAVQALRKDTYVIQHEALMVESIRQKNIDIRDIDITADPATLAKALYNKGALGVRHHNPEPPTAREMAARWGAK